MLSIIGLPEFNKESEPGTYCSRHATDLFVGFGSPALSPSMCSPQGLDSTQKEHSRRKHGSNRALVHQNMVP